MLRKPPFTGWSSTGPYEPEIRTSPLDGRRKLYGRGGADDGYSTFSAVTAVAALRAQLRLEPRHRLAFGPVEGQRVKIGDVRGLGERPERQGRDPLVRRR